MGETSLDERHEVEEEILVVNRQSRDSLIGRDDVVGGCLAGSSNTIRLKGKRHHRLRQGAEKHEETIDHRMHTHCIRCGGKKAINKMYMKASIAFTVESKINYEHAILRIGMSCLVVSKVSRMMGRSERISG